MYGCIGLNARLILVALRTITPYGTLLYLQSVPSVSK